MNDLLIVGAGPTGLTAAVEAVRHGLSVRIVDANKSRSVHSKALVLHSRSLEVLPIWVLSMMCLKAGRSFEH